MKRNIFLSAGLAAVLAACGSKSEELANSCTAALGNDAIVTGMIASQGLSIDDYCSCFAKQPNLKSDDSQYEMNLAVMKAVAEAREDGKVSVPEAATKIEQSFDAGGTEYSFTKEEFDRVGESLEAVVDAMADAEGCPFK